MSRKKKNKQQISKAGGIWILIIAALVLETTACIQYFYSQEGIRREADNHAIAELKRAELEINVICARVEMAVQHLALLAERDINNPDSLLSITNIMVKNTPNMIGAAIAMKENYFPQYGKWFEAYSSETEACRLIGNANHDYFQSQWYKNGMTIDSCWWCEPYMDDSGAKEMIVSCSFPIRHKGEIVGVALADVSLKHLQSITEYLQVYPNSYYSIISGGGNDLVPPPDTVAGRKYHIYEEFIEANGWTMKVIIPDDEIYAELKRVGLVVTIMMILGLVLLIFIMYRSAQNMLKLLDVNNQKQRMESELSIARNIQMAMLPKTFPPYHNREDLDIYGIIVPAKEVGGDLYDFYIRQDKLLFCVGDVSGKGVPASLVMAVTRSLFRTISSHEDNPAKIVTQMNDAMSEMNDQNMFVTLFLGILDLKTGDMEYCNAGHDAPVLVSNKTKQVDKINVQANLPIGILSGFAFIGQSTHINRNDTMFLYTDGLTEAENITKELFGEKRMIEAIEVCAETHDIKESGSKTYIELMQEAVRKFVEDADQSDDLTMMAIHYQPDENKEDSSHDIVTRDSIVMRNDIQQIPTLAEWVEGLGIPEVLNMTLNLALEEAVTNVMLYAYPDKSGTVLIKSEKSAAQIKFEISDSGIPFDPTQQKEADITLSAEERAIGGLGIHLVRQIMDEISYERKDDKNILTIIKYFKQ